MKSAGTDLHVQGLHYQASLFGPIILQGLNQALKATQIGRGIIVHLDDWLKARDYNQLEFFPHAFSVSFRAHNRNEIAKTRHKKRPARFFAYIPEDAALPRT